MTDRDSLIEENLGLVRYAIKMYFPYGLGDDDVYQAGCEGLIKAADSYKPQRGKFSTFAVWRIRCEITNQLRKLAKDNKFLSLDTACSEDGEPLINAIADESVDVEQEAITTTTIDCMLEGATPRAHKIFNAVYNNGLSQIEIAKQMGLTKQCVNQTLKFFRGKKHAGG